MVKEIEADAKAYGDARRTLIRRRKRRVAEVKVVDEPVTGGGQDKGLGARGGPRTRWQRFAFKAGDGLYGTFECRTVDNPLVFSSNGRVYSVAVSLLPGGRGDGQPITTSSNWKPARRSPISPVPPGGCAAAVPASTAPQPALPAVENMVSRHQAGKALTCNAGVKPCAHRRWWPGALFRLLPKEAKGEAGAHCGGATVLVPPATPRGLRASHWVASDLRDCRTQDDGQWRPRPHVAGPGDRDVWPESRCLHP